MSYLKNQYTVEQLLDGETFNAIETTKLFKYMLLIEDKECGILKRKTSFEINSNKELLEKEKIKIEFDAFRNEFQVKMECKLEGHIFNGYSYFVDDHIDKWIEDLTHFNMEMNYSSLYEARKKAITQVLSSVNNMIKLNSNYNLDYNNVVKNIKANSIYSETIENINKNIKFKEKEKGFKLS